MLVALVTTVSFAGELWTGPLASEPGSRTVACTREEVNHVAEHTVSLATDGLVYVELSEWDVPVVVGLADGSHACHGAFQPPPPLTLDARAPRGMVRWLPAGDHTITVQSAEASSAILAVNVVTPDDLEAHGIDGDLARVALLAADQAWTDGHAQRPALAILDFSRPSTEERLWLVDLSDGQLLHHLFVSHGKASGHATDARRSVRFSNRPFSNQTSPGLFRASETYKGDHGRSMRLDGLEPGVNDLARDRAIVVHGAEYARVDHIAEWGYLGRSHGCPAVDDRVVQSLIDALHDGGLLYARGNHTPADCCALRAGTESSPDAPYLPDPLGLISVY